VSDLFFYPRCLTFIQGRKITLGVELSDSIESVKQQIQNKQDIQVVNQRLVFAGKLLENGNTLADYNIQNGSIITLAIGMGAVQIDVVM
jgi:hypothetical protein